MFTDHQCFKRYLKLNQWLLSVGCGRRTSDVKLQACLTITDHPYSTPKPQTCVSSIYGILWGQNVFLQIKFSPYDICLEFENASGVETMVGMSLNLILPRDLLLLRGRKMPLRTWAFSPLPNASPALSPKSPTALIPWLRPPHKGTVTGWGASALPASSLLVLSTLPSVPLFSFSFQALILLCQRSSLQHKL